MVKIKIERKGYFWSGIAILALLILTYIVKFPADAGSNFITYDSLLGIIIFHNPFILAVYLIIAIKLIMNGLKKK